jgi:hypothetical protein
MMTTQRRDLLTYAAYNAASPTLAETPSDEEHWYALLAAEPLIGGLELGFTDTLHPHGAGRLATLLDPGWSSTVTTIPGTLAALRRGEPFGLASTSDEHRRRAVTAIARLLTEIRRLQSALGEQVIRAVLLHSAPAATPEASSPDLFTDSLTQIASWDWGDIRLALEHADALVPEHDAAKGFLPLEQEIGCAALASERSGRTIGHSVNWGRSAIETRSASGPLQHIRRLEAAGLLSGLVFSGASGEATPYSRPWEDVHLAVDTAEPASLLTARALRECLAAVGDRPLEFVGVKVGARGTADSAEERLAAGLATLHALDDAMDESARV